MIARLLVSLGLALIASQIFTPAARAAELCNETSYVVDVAAGWPVEGGVAIEGWTRVRPGECENMATEVDLDSDQPIFYYAKTSAAYLGGVREWRGNVPLCVDETDFDVVANTQCAALGLASRDFIMREGVARERTVLVEPEDFGSRASIAGIQRLLQSAGYPISSVDGFDGRGTRRAVNLFIEDIELSRRPADRELMDRLEARALERNGASGLTLCNTSQTDIAAAIGYRREEIWQSRGWWRLHSGECARMLATRLENQDVFYRVEQINLTERQQMTGGDQTFCLAPARFVAEGREDCNLRGYGEAQFRQISEPDDGGVRITITPDDFEEARLAP